MADGKASPGFKAWRNVPTLPRFFGRIAYDSAGRAYIYNPFFDGHLLYMSSNPYTGRFFWNTLLETWTAPLSPEQWALTILSPSADLLADFPFMRRHRELSDVVSPHEGLTRAYEDFLRAQREDVSLEPDFMYVVLAEHLDRLYQMWSDDERDHFATLLRVGPHAQMVIWASASYEGWRSLPEAWRRAFRKALYGPFDATTPEGQQLVQRHPKAAERYLALARLRPGQALIWDEAGKPILLAANLVGLSEGERATASTAR
ncbi:MAG: hypothetical protein GXO54_06000 [Chloroflexi bacterium]|nr:hypothetical protein [Chloroflexota bacterium]